MDKLFRAWQRIMAMPRVVSALRRAVRTAIVAFAGLSIGLWGLHNGNVAVFATFSGFALVGIADFGGPMPRRAAAYMAASLGGVALVALGTWTSSQSLAVDGVGMFVVGAVIVMSALLGGYFAAASNALPLYYLVAVGTPAAASAIPGRIVGVLFGGLISTLAALLLWPSPEEPGVLPEFGKKVSRLAQQLELAIDGESDHDTAVILKPGEVRRFIDSLEGRPASPTASDRAAVYLVNDLERITRLIAHVRNLKLSENDKKMLLAVSTQLAAVGLMLQPGGVAKTGEMSPALTGRVTGFSLPARLVVSSQRLAEHAMVASGHFDNPDCKMQGLDHDESPGATFRHGLKRLRANLSWDSVHLRDAVRTGAGLAIAIVIARQLHLQHGFWVALATLTVVRSNVSTTSRRAGQAIGGTLIGFAVSFAVIMLLGSDEVWYAVLTPILIALAIYCNVAVGLLAGQAAFTAVVIVLFNLLAPSGWPVGIVRLEDVAAGCVIGLLVSLIAWPRGAISSLRTSVADLISSSTDYLGGTLQAFLPETNGIPGDGTNPRVLADAAKAEDAFAQYLSEKPSAVQLDAWAQVLSAANRLWYAADLIRSLHLATGNYPEERDLESVLWKLEHNNREAERSLRVGKTVRLSQERGSDSAESSISGWLREIATQFKVTT